MGFDLSYDPSQVTATIMEGKPVNNRWSFVLPGISAAYTLVISKVGIVMNLGYYPGQKRPNGPYYEKLAVQYNFAPHFFTQLMLKAHGTTAAYITLGMGYRFHVRLGKKSEI